MFLTKKVFMYFIQNELYYTYNKSNIYLFLFLTFLEWRAISFLITQLNIHQAAHNSLSCKTVNNKQELFGYEC